MRSFLEHFRGHAGPAGTMTFARFMQLALYDPSLGYYHQPRRRVGRAPGTDFFTASNSPLFGELVAAACTSLLAAHHAHPHDFTFVEIGAECPGGILANTPHPFGATKTFRLGDPLELNGRCVVFSNELFDAQPFHRFVFRRGAWRELGVALRENSLVEVELPEATSAPLPASAPEEYCIDTPLEAAALAGRIAAKPWSGLFLAFDYGKAWTELAEATPAGTARAYFRHAQSNDLLARPGEQDLTCHVCWDWLADALTRRKFATPQVESQESFFVHHAAEFLASTTAAEAAASAKKNSTCSNSCTPRSLGKSSRRCGHGESKQNNIQLWSATKETIGTFSAQFAVVLGKQAIRR